MKCPSEIKWMEFADGELEIEERQTLESHAAQCPTCRATLHEFRRVNAFGRMALGESEEPAIRVVEFPTPQYSIIKRGIAVAAAIAVGALISHDVLTDNRSAIEQFTKTESNQNSDNSAIEIDPSRFSDEVFEAWAAPFKNREAPLIALQDVPKYFEETHKSHSN